MMKRTGLIILTALVIVAVPAWSVSQKVNPPDRIPAKAAEISRVKPDAAPSAQAAVDSKTTDVLLTEGSPFVLPNLTATPVFKVESLPESYRIAMNGVSWNTECPVPMDKLRRVKVGYVGFDGQTMQGELVVHQSVSDEIVNIFKELYAAGYPIKSIAVVDIYMGDDTLSMDADNTSAFNYRPVTGAKTLSKHSYGIAIDINPIENPYIKGEVLSPAAGRNYVDRSIILPGMIIAGDPCYRAFTSRGWIWGGNWKTLKDYQHFEKPLKL